MIKHSIIVKERVVVVSAPGPGTPRKITTQEEFETFLKEKAGVVPGMFVKSRHNSTVKVNMLYQVNYVCFEERKLSNISSWLFGFPESLFVVSCDYMSRSPVWARWEALDNIVPVTEQELNELVVPDYDKIQDCIKAACKGKGITPYPFPPLRS